MPITIHQGFKLAALEVERAEQKLKIKQGSFWRKEDPVLDEKRSLIKGGMWEHQRKWWDLNNSIAILVGGFGAGKTLIGSKGIISLALENAPCPVIGISPSFPIAKKTTIPTIQALLEGKRKLAGLVWRFNKTSHTFEIQHRGRSATIYIGSGDDPDSLRGPNLAGAWIDEPFIQAKEVFTHTISRIRHPEARRMKLLITGTPEELNWGYDLCVKEEEEEDFKDLDVGVVFASSRDNLALDPRVIKQWEAHFDERAAQAYIDGRFVSLSKGQVYYAFDPMENVAKLQMPEGAELGAGMDFNVNPMAFVVFWVKWTNEAKGEGHMHILKEYELQNSDTELACSTLVDDGWARKGLRKVYPDPTGKRRHTNAPGGKSDFTYIREAGFEVVCRSGSPAQKDRYNAVNGKLKPRDGNIALTIEPGQATKNLRKHLALYSHEHKNTEAHKAMSHLLDALGYPIEYLFPVSKDVVRKQPILGT